MNELTLKFEDENGVERRFSVRQEIFTVGRHSECDLSIADGRLSREHLKIERFGDIFVASDLGSSNGTILGGRKLESPTKLQNGDTLNLGGLEFKIALNSNGYAKNSPSYFDDDDDSAETKPVQEPEKKAAPIAPSANSQSASASANSGAIPKSFYLIAPLFGVFVLLLIGGGIYVFSGKNETEIAENGGNFIYSSNEDEPKNTDEDNENTTKTPGGSNVNSSGSNVNSSVSTGNNSTSEINNSSVNSNAPTPTPANLSETAKIEQNSASFLRKIAQNDPKAFLTSDQAKIVSGRIKQFSNSAVADNIKSARANAAQIQALANAKNLRPQFLAVAAISRLGNNRGNVLQTAQGMTENLDKLLIHVGGERGDDALLMIAAYDQSAAGRVLDFRNMLQQLSNQFPESSRTIRTIWFLKQKGKISDAEYESALRFLAIGTITQNPKDFAVNAEELKLN